MGLPRFAWSLTAAGLLAALWTGTADAQNNTPFSSTYRRPSISPYTMLATNGSTSVAPDGSLQTNFNPLVYQQLIQPREDQERMSVMQMQQGRQLGNIQNRVQEIQQGTTARQVNEQIRPTGHAATYLNMSHYYGR